MKTEQKEIRGRFLLWWVLATTTGWGLSLLLGIVAWVPFYRAYSALFGVRNWAHVSNVSYAFEQAANGAFLGILFGVTIGFFQWLVLRRHISRACWWIVATIAGLGLGTPLAAVAQHDIFDNNFWVAAPLYLMLIAATVPGIVVGLLQRLVLQRHFDRTWWWILSSALTWPVSLVFLLPEGGYIFPVIWGLLSGTISGLTLLHISSRCKEGLR